MPIRSGEACAGAVRKADFGLCGYVLVHLHDFPVPLIKFIVRRVTDVGVVIEQLEAGVAGFEQVGSGGNQAGVCLRLFAAVDLHVGDGYAGGAVDPVANDVRGTVTGSAKHPWAGSAGWYCGRGSTLRLGRSATRRPASSQENAEFSRFRDCGLASELTEQRGTGISPVPSQA